MNLDQTLSMVYLGAAVVWLITYPVARHMVSTTEPHPVPAGQLTSRSMRLRRKDYPMGCYRVFDLEEAETEFGLHPKYAVNPETGYPVFDTRVEADTAAERLGFIDPIVEQWSGEYWVSTVEEQGGR
jgi:hypothetical protein